MDALIMPTDRLKIYVGCSLTHAPEDFKNDIVKLKHLLAKTYETTEFIGLVNGTPADVYQWDVHRCLAECDLFLAICDHPAIGLGYELGTAIEAWHKPVLAVAHTSAHVSRLVLGINAAGYSFERYNDITDIPPLVHQKLITSNLIKES